MDKTQVYIKKILALAVVSATGFVLTEFIKYYYILPFCFFTLAFLITRITGEKPYYLYGLPEAEKYLNNKGGFWLLFKWIFGFLGLAYDIIAMTLNGIFFLFVIFTDILFLLKTAIYWVVYGIIRFLDLFVPPIVFLFRIFIHYIFKWPWWIYKLSYKNTGVSINRNFYQVSYRGSFLALFVFFVFLGAGSVTGIMLLIIPGIVFALLPMVWSFGVISLIRRNKLTEVSYSTAKSSYSGGYDAMRIVLNYLSLILIFLIVVVILNILGWIPSAGFSLLGISLNVTTLLQIILLYLGVIILFAVIILPPHVVISGSSGLSLIESVRFIGIIGKKFLRYLSALFPASFFSAALLIIPVLIISIAAFLTLTLRDNILDARIEMLKEKEILTSSPEKYEIRRNIKLLQFYQSFPQNVIKEFSGIKELSKRIHHINDNLLKAEEDLIKMEYEYNLSSDSLNNVLSTLRNSPDANLANLEIERVESIKEIKKERFETWRNIKLSLMADIRSEISFSKIIIISYR